MRNSIVGMESSPFYNEATYVGQTGYYNGRQKVYQCVNFVIGYIQEYLDKKVCYYKSIGEDESYCDDILFNRGGYGNACDWIKNTRWEVGTEPRVGAIMVYGTKWGNGCGHVRVVNEVGSNYLLVSGGNEDGKGLCKFYFKISKPEVTKNGFLGYIYVPVLNDIKEDEYKTLYMQEKAKNEALNGIVEQIKEIIK